MDTTAPKHKILSVTKVPPPITGATLSNLRFLNSKAINASYTFVHLKVSYANEVSNLGKLSIKKIASFFSLLYKTINQLINFKPDLVYFQISPKGIAFIRDFTLVVIMKLARKKIVFHMRGIGINSYAQKSSLFRILYQIAFRGSFIICFSELVKQDLSLVYKGVPYVVPNGIVPEIPEKHLFEKQSQESKKVKVLFISNYLEAKGVFDIIEAARNITSKKFEIIMIGAISDQKTHQTMLAKITEYGLENIVYPVGAKYKGEKLRYLLDSDIFVFPTHNEGFGNVALEAMEACLPVITYHEGSLPYIVEDGITGFVLPKKNIVALGEKLDLLISDSKLRQEMGFNGRKRFLDLFTIEKFESNMINTFNSILSHE